MITPKDNSSRAVGRRKTSSARVKLVSGKGEVVINGKALKDYFRTTLLQERVLKPLFVSGKEKSLDVSAKVAGGGTFSQSDAVAHGIARALVGWNAELRPALKAEGLLTRDPRAKERKKFGRHGARRGHQWRKR